MWTIHDETKTENKYTDTKTYANKIQNLCKQDTRLRKQSFLEPVSANLIQNFSYEKNLGTYETNPCTPPSIWALVVLNSNLILPESASCLSWVKAWTPISCKEC